MTTFDTVLVPTDDSEHAVRAAEYAATIARAFDATVHLLTVVDLRTAAGAFSAGGIDKATKSRLEADAEETVVEVSDGIGAATEVQTAVRSGMPVDEILTYRDDNEIDLITMGTHGRTGVSRYVMGSVTEQIVRKASVPVCTVRATERSRTLDACDEILLPTDGSEFAGAAVDPALAVAKQFHARVHVVRIVDVGDIAINSEYTAPEALFERLTEEAETVTESIAARARAAELEAVTHVREGFPATDILEYAEENDIGMIAMGTAGRTGLNRFLLGSTTERVIRHADMPVLAVNIRGNGPE